ncbi:hypothetical protein HGRIS_008100 [Hohenbuehelia grisea]|uniref:FAS1 domain-containing protein n=1 Tax=Hohenbuehelia grisea TaxID=104357 RepID=A0ABR3J7C7_9AGAR
MRLWSSLPLTLAAALWPVAVWPAQVAWNSTQSSLHLTLVDVLNADPDYESLIVLLQKAKLIPTLNRLNGSTLFAPTNDAIRKHKAHNVLWRSVLDDEGFLLNDNIQHQLRQQLFYHLLNFSLPTWSDEDPSLQVLKTLHFPQTPLEPPTRQPPPSPPWMPIPTGTLGNEPQRLRTAARDRQAFVGVDAFGAGGAEIIKGKVDAGNGVLLGISDVLDPPGNMAHVVTQHASLSYLNRVLTPEITNLLKTTTELTLFLPIDKAWEALHPLERLYLESGFATDDLNSILNMHAVVQKKVFWSDSFEPALKLPTLHGQELDIVVTPEKTIVSGATLVHPDIYASNGVLHLVDTLLVPPGALEITPEKYLLALNCTTFVSLIHSVNLTHLINSTEAKYTILAPRDDILDVYGDDDIPERGSLELKKMLEYHFIPGRWTPKKLQDGMLVETALEEEGLAGRKQVLGIEVTENEGDKKKPAERSIRFGGTGVIADHVEVNNTVVYFISTPLTPPIDALATALPDFDLSIFLAAISSTSLADTLKTTPRTSLLIPRNSAFERLGLLVSAHLLAASSKQDLIKVVLHHTLDSVQYDTALHNDSQRTFATLEGSDLTLERQSENSTLLLSASGGWAGMRSNLTTRNLLTKTGVLHELSDVLIPRSVQLNVGKLVKAAKGSTMASLVNKAGMEWVLNGTAPPEDSEWADKGLGGAGWTLLCPTDDAFKGHNLTKLYNDPQKLKDVVAQHLIPTPPKKSFADDPLNNNRPLVLDDSVTYTTLNSPGSAYGDVVFKQQEDGAFIVGIKGARGTEGRTDFARVLSWGRATTGSGTGGVIQIDSLLMPYSPTWWYDTGAPLLVGGIGVGLICLFFLGVRAVWRKDTTEATYEPVGGFGRDDEP